MYMPYGKRDIPGIDVEFSTPANILVTIIYNTTFIFYNI